MTLKVAPQHLDLLYSPAVDFTRYHLGSAPTSHQRKDFQPISTHYERLPAGTKAHGVKVCYTQT